MYSLLTPSAGALHIEEKEGETTMAIAQSIVTLLGVLAIAGSTTTSLSPAPAGHSLCRAHVAIGAL